MSWHYSDVTTFMYDVTPVTSLRFFFFFFFFFFLSRFGELENGE